jgi:hypothetical protein
MVVVFTQVVLLKIERDLKRGLLKFSAALALTAKQENLFEDREFRADVQTVSKFEITRMKLKGKKGKGFRHVVTFEAKFISGDILALADSWIRAVGDGVGTLRVNGTLVEATEEAAA